MTVSEQNYPKSIKNLEDMLFKIQTSRGVAKKLLGIISNSDKISQKFLQGGIYSATIEFDPKIDTRKNDKAINDLDTIDLSQLIDDKKFDIIYIGDILHYTIDPSKTLNQLSFHLNEKGSLIGYLHNISHASSRVRLLDGDFNCEKIGLNEDVLHHYNLDSMLILLDSANYSLTSLYKIKDDVNIKRTDLFHYKFPLDLLDAILADHESDTLYYIFEAAPKTRVDKFTRKWTGQFSRNIVTEKLESIIESYKKIIAEKSSIIDYYHKVIKDKQISIQKIEGQEIEFNADENKEPHLLQIIEQKDILTKGLMESIDKQNTYIESLTKSIEEKDSGIKDLTKLIEDLTKLIEEKDKKIKELQEILLARSNELVKIHNSFTWKILRRLDKIRQK